MLEPHHDTFLWMYLCVCFNFWSIRYLASEASRQAHEYGPDRLCGGSSSTTRSGRQSSWELDPSGLAVTLRVDTSHCSFTPATASAHSTASVGAPPPPPAKGRVQYAASLVVQGGDTKSEYNGRALHGSYAIAAPGADICLADDLNLGFVSCAFIYPFFFLSFLTSRKMRAHTHPPSLH